MREQTIAIYCFIDDFFLAIGRKDEAHCKLYDAGVLTTALLAGSSLPIRLPAVVTDDF